MPQLVPISPRGTITLPKSYREKHNFKTPGKVKIDNTSKGVELKPLPDFESLYGSLANTRPSKPLDFSRLRREFEEEVAQKKHG